MIRVSWRARRAPMARPSQEFHKEIKRLAILLGGRVGRFWPKHRHLPLHPPSAIAEYPKNRHVGSSQLNTAVPVARPAGHIDLAATRHEHQRYSRDHAASDR